MCVPNSRCTLDRRAADGGLAELLLSRRRALSGSGVAERRVERGRLLQDERQVSVLEEPLRVLGAQVGAQRVDAAVRGRTVGAHGALRRVRVVVVPAVRHLLAARSAAPHRPRITRRREHIVIGHCVMVTNTTTASMQWVVERRKVEARCVRFVLRRR